jgi:hypothetical protein
MKGWRQIAKQLLADVVNIGNRKTIIAVEYYQGVFDDEISAALTDGIGPAMAVSAKDLMWPEDYNREMVFPDVTDDRIFGRITQLTINDYFDPKKLAEAELNISSVQEGVVLILGTGATLICQNPDILVYADMARWEIQLRMRKHEVNNLGLNNKGIADWMLLYKQGYFVDWRGCDEWKK